MQTLKTAVVVVLLLAVLYGAYTVLSQPEPPPPRDIADLDEKAMESPDIDLGDGELDDDSFDAAESETEEHEGHDHDHAGQAHETPADTVGPDDQHAAVEAPPLTGDENDAGDARYSSAGPTDDGDEAAAEVSSPEPRIRDNPYVRDLPAASTDTPGDQAAEPDPTDAGQASTTTARAFRREISKAQSLVDEKRYREALESLTLFYNSPDLSEDEHRELLEMLDPLAGKVVYSKEHLLDQPHKIGRDERLSDIATQYDVPPQLLQNINSIRDPNVLVPGTDLKVMRGPFSAEVDLQRSELTVFVGGMYAGRFPISVGNDPPPEPGEYQVRDKRRDRTYYAADGNRLPPGHPGNPYGDVWLDLGNELCIHGSPESVEQGTLSAGCISLSPLDAADVFAILSEGSPVVIRP